MNSPAWFRELKPYTESALTQQLHLSATEGKECVRRLVRTNILRPVVKKDASMEEILPENLLLPLTGQEKVFTFNFTGILIYKEQIICCYPKYIRQEDDRLQEKFIQILAVLHRYSATGQSVMLARCGQHDQPPTFLAILMELIHQYHKHGFYRNRQHLQELSGTGEINWERTINMTQAYISKGQVFYPDIYTEKTLWDDSNFFYRLHQCIIAECYQYFNDNQLGPFFPEIRGNFHYDRKISDFGSRESILIRLQKERNRKFITFRRNQLEAMIMYVSMTGRRSQNQIVFYGTTSMNLVWEEACRQVIGNHLDRKIRKIEELPEYKRKDPKYKKQTLMDLIERPEWIAQGQRTGIKKSTLRPDLICIQKDYTDNLHFLIYDAKYYNLIMSPTRVEKQPGIESVTKQYLYHMAYKNFLEDFSIEDVKNIFLFPMDCADSNSWNTMELKGYVTMPMLRGCTDVDIQAVMLDADNVWDCYLNHKKIDIIKELSNGGTDAISKKPQHVIYPVS